MLDSPCKQLSVGPKFDQNPMCGRKDMKEIRGSLILTWLSWILCIDFQMNDLSPFSQSLWQHLRQPYVAIQTTERPRQTSRINSPPEIHICQTSSWNFSTTTEPFPTIPTALQSPHEYLSNGV